MKNNFFNLRPWVIISKFCLAYLLTSISFNLILMDCLAQELVLGVPLVEQPLNLISSEHPFAELIRQATTKTLVKRDQRKASGFQLILADSFNTSLDGKGMELRLRPSLTFHNSKLFEVVDVKASLQRCLQSPTAPILASQIKFNVVKKQQRIYVSVESTDGQSAIIDFLESCPIFEERSLRLFGNDLGNNNLILGNGAYHLVSRAKNREARLERVAHSAGFAATITIRGFGDQQHALTALRSGTLDAFYTQDKEVEMKANNDPTLLITACGVYNIILRKGLEIGCYPSSDPSAIKYSAI